MKKQAVWLSLVLMLILNLFTDTNGQPAGYTFRSFPEFRTTLDKIVNIIDSAERMNQVNNLWTRLKEDSQIPFRMDDSVAFLYRGAAKTVSWAGDFNGWNPDAKRFAGIRQGLSDIWMAVQKFPEDARLDYKIVVNGNWILDPDNPNIQWSGMGPNSELRMPGWKFPEETILSPDVIRGNLSENILIKSEKLGYQVNYKVYTPFNYFRCENLPVIYVTDGHEYADDLKGGMILILDNLIFSGEIRPVIAVFIDPREPGKESNNRRMQEYVCNQKFADFVGDELIPVIDKNYKTHACPDDRAILGTSLGGMNSAWFGAVRARDFHLLGIQSPAFNKTVLECFANLEWFPFRVFMTTGVVYDTQEQALNMKAILDKNQVPYVYREVNEGHSWGNWRALLGDMLRWFFPK
ncbi:MAG: alpha/beta hydrolase-fold protein [Bacteroidota bacterium]